MGLGVKLRRLRQQRNWSQAEVAQRLDISQPAYNKWESDQAKPNVQNLMKISEVYDIDIYELLENYPNVDLSGSQFTGGTNIVGNSNPTIKVQSPEMLDSVLNIFKSIQHQNEMILTLLKEKNK